MKRTGPLDDLPIPLTSEAKRDKEKWEIAISALSGEERRRQAIAFTARYKVQPTLVPHYPTQYPETF